MYNIVYCNNVLLGKHGYQVWLNMNELLIAGIRDLSLVDVHGSIVSTIWLCKCNLKCPYCHNWRIAIGDQSICQKVSIEWLIDRVKTASKFIDYVHITGGEPLLQINGLKELCMRLREEDLRVSLNSNLTLPDHIEKLLEKELVDHVATDLKIPFNLLTGLAREYEILWSNFVESLEIISSHNIILELRIPVARRVTLENIERVLNELKPVLSRIKDMYCIVNPLTGPPLIDVRDPVWCRDYCNPGDDELLSVKMIVEKILGVKTIVKKWWRIT